MRQAEGRDNYFQDVLCVVGYLFIHLFWLIRLTILDSPTASIDNLTAGGGEAVQWSKLSPPSAENIK